MRMGSENQELLVDNVEVYRNIALPHLLFYLCFLLDKADIYISVCVCMCVQTIQFTVFSTKTVYTFFRLMEHINFH